MATIYQVTRRTSGDAGPPASLRSGQMFYNMVDGKLYIGFGDNGSGVATSIKVFAEDDYGGAGVSVTEGDGIDITGGEVSIDPSTFTGTFGTAAIPNLDAAKITSGAFHVDRVPALDTAKITSGEFDAARIPNLAAAKITSGEFDAARIPSLDASKIGSGVFDIARIPVLPSSVQIVSSGTIANLTAPQQAEIGDGSVVTTTDGRRWVYSGSGSKTAEASYVELADVTPEWSVIANKPSFHAVATSGDYDDLTDKPTLGTMAAQNASAVAITGGTIDGVILDGGTL